MGKGVTNRVYGWSLKRSKNYSFTSKEVVQNKVYKPVVYILWFKTPNLT